MINQQVNVPVQLKDDFLIEQIRASNDNTCVEALYNRYSNKIYGKCLSMVKDSTLAEDLTHDIFIKSLLNLAAFKGKSKFSTWIYSITYNHCIDSIRKRRKINLLKCLKKNIKLKTMNTT